VLQAASANAASASQRVMRDDAFTPRIVPLETAVAL
jgi:hypothetical protein